MFTAMHSWPEGFARLVRKGTAEALRAQGNSKDLRIRLRRQAFEDVEIDGEDVQHNGEFPSVVQRFQLDRLLAMPDDFGDIKQISLDIEFLSQPHHEYKKQLISNDLNSVITTTQNATEGDICTQTTCR